MRKLTVALLTMLAAFSLSIAQDVELPAPEQPDVENETEPVEPVEKQAPELPEEIRPSSSKPLDIIVAVDASGSVAWTDPHSFRKAFTHLLGEMMHLRTGDRLAIVQFAGWNETSVKGATLLELEEITEDSVFFASEVKSAVNELEPFGAATDFNFAFEKAIQEVLNKRTEAGSKNKIWLVLISDGSMEVVEEGSVREAYVSRAQEQDGRVNRVSLNEAARQMFYENVLPKIAANQEMQVTCICLGKEEPGQIMQKIGELDNASLLQITQESLRDVAVKAFSDLPEAYHDYGMPRGFGYLKSSAEPGSGLMHPFNIYEGTVVTRLLVLADTSDYALDVENSAGDSIADMPSVTVAGEGNSYRLVTVVGEPSGTYKLTLANASDSVASFEVLQYVDIKLDLYVGTKGLQSRFYPGESLSLDVGLRQVKSSVFVSDPTLISEAEAFLLVRDVDGNVFKTVAPFLDTSRAVTSAQYTLPTDAAGGEYELAVRVVAFKNTISGRYAFVSEPVTIPFSVLSPVVELSLLQKEALVGQEIGVAGAVTTGSLTEKQKQEGIKARIVHAFSQSEKEIDLSWDEESEKLKGTVTLNEPKEWRLQEVQIGTGQIKPVEAEQAVLVSPRGVHVLIVTEDGKRVAVEKLRIKGQIDAPVTTRFIVQPDLIPGEIAELSAKPGGVAGSAEMSVSLTGKEGASTTISMAESEASYDLVLKLKSQPEEEEIGEIVISAEFPGATVTKKLPVSTEVPPAAFPWLLAAIIAAIIAAIVIIILMLVGGPTFDQQQLYIVGGQGHYLKEWKVGRKNAVGTTLNPGKLQFRLKGGKAKPQCMVMPGKSARVFINNIECTYWKNVKHGDYIEIYPEGDEYAYRYRYFDRNPTAAELRDQGEVTERIDAGVFLEEDEFILAEDDFEGVEGEATQALLEQARRLKGGTETEPTKLVIQSSDRTTEDALDEVFSEKGPEYEQTEIIREAASLPQEQDVTEAVPPMPDEPTEMITSGFFGEEDESEATQAIGSEEDVFFEEMPTEAGLAGEGFDLPIAEEIDSEPTQAIGEEEIADELAGEATQAIIPESDFPEGGVLTEPTEEIDETDVEELTGLIEDRLEMSEFIEEESAESEESEDEGGENLADELDKTFDKILGEEEDEGEL